MATSGTGRLALMSPRGRALSFLMLHGRLLTMRLPSVSYAIVVFGLGGFGGKLGVWGIFVGDEYFSHWH